MKIKLLYLRCFISIIILMIISYMLNNNICYKELDYLIFQNNIDFSYIRSKTNLLFKDFNGSKYVSSDKLIYKNIEKYNNSFKITTDYNYVIKNLYKGNVIYIGDKDNLGNTVIISSDNGVYYWYSNLENININLYDYIDTNTIIGSTINNYFYLTLVKDSEYLNYEEYI